MSNLVILFDLDGTLTDPKIGITRSIQYALTEMGYSLDDGYSLDWCIGPPLKGCFAQLLNTSDETILNKALSLYRSRFSTVGLFENFLYPQITETLKIIRHNYKTFVATSKPHVYAKRIIEHFGLLSLFDGIYGSELDGTHSNKSDLIQHILLMENLSPTSTVMVGDRHHDIIGAKANGVYSIGVTYGYGTEQELEASGADFIAYSPDDIPKLVEKLK
ncbi:similar to indigoidine systhesis protein IdgB [Rivularia sp. IAM M-261]|nr:similar to indigoidine systhesis protein IdgB [Rivularia sp. IAM M-261]